MDVIAESDMANSLFVSKTVRQVFVRFDRAVGVNAPSTGRCFMMANLSGTMFSSWTCASSATTGNEETGKTDPILRGASHKRILVAASGRVTLDRVTPGPHQIEKLGKLDDEMVIVHPVERVVFQVILVKRLLQREPS
jgi:hypothetical protein